MKMARTDNKTDVRIVKLSDGVEFWNQDIPDPSSSLSTNVDDVFNVSYLLQQMSRYVLSLNLL